MLPSEKAQLATDGLQPGNISTCLGYFTYGLRYQVVAFGACLHTHPNLPNTFKDHLDAAVDKVLSAADDFKHEVMTASNSIRWELDDASEKPIVDGQKYHRPMVINLDDELGLIKTTPEATESIDISQDFMCRLRANTNGQSYGDAIHNLSQDGKNVNNPEQGSASPDSPRTVEKVDSSNEALASRAISSMNVIHMHSGSYSNVEVGPSATSSASPANARPVMGNAETAATATTAIQTLLQAAGVYWDSEDGEEDPSGPFIRGVLNPNFMGKLAWDLNTMFLVLCDVMILPYQMAYKDGDAPDAFDIIWLWVTTSFFASDMCLSFLTAYQAGRRDTDTEPGKLVTDKVRIARNYIRTWLVLDFVSTVPWGVLTDLILGGGSGSAGQLGKLTKIVKFVRFMRLMRMLRLAKLAAIWERVEANCGSVLLIQGVGLLRVLFVLVCICHWNACIWWMIGQEKSLITELLSDEDQKIWMKEPHWTTIQRSNGPGEPSWTWRDRSTAEAYIFCFYWTLGVMRTMPAEVTPVSQPERIYVMVFMFFAFSAFAICVAQISQTFFKFSERKRVFNDDMAAVRMHMRKIKAGEQLQTRIKSYIRHLFDIRSIAAREDGLIQRLPHHLQRELFHIKRSAHLEKLDIFSNVSFRALQIVSDIAEPREMAPGDVCSLKGRVADAAWVLTLGRLKIQPEEGVTDADTHKRITVVDEKTLIEQGVYESPFSVLCVSSCSCLRIDKEIFLKKANNPATHFWNSLHVRRSSNASVRGRMTRAFRGNSVTSLHSPSAGENSTSTNAVQHAHTAQHVQTAVMVS